MNQSLIKETSKLSLKNVKVYQQLSYLQRAREQKFLPRGIADQIKFVSSVKDPALQQSLQDLMDYTGSRILDLLICYYTKWSNNAKTSYYTSLKKLEQSTSEDEFTILKQNLNKKMAQEKSVVEKTHSSKLERDCNKIKVPYKALEETKATNIIKSTHQKCRPKPTRSRKFKKTEKKHKHRNKNRQAIKGTVPSIEKNQYCQNKELCDQPFIEG